MPFSLFVGLYDYFQSKHEKEFDQHNKILTPEDIRELLARPDGAAVWPVLRSAVTDHRPVDGIPYHLRYPFSAMFYHDGFKRTMIAAGIGRKLNPSTGPEWEDARAVLAALTCPEQNAGYVIILAWDALGRMSRHRPQWRAGLHSQLRAALGGSVAQMIGALVYCDHLWAAGARDAVRDVLAGAEGDVRFRTQRVLYYAYLDRRDRPRSDRDVGSLPETGQGITRFLARIRRGRRLDQNDLAEGLVLVDLLSPGRPLQFWDNTPHAVAGRQVIDAARIHLMTAGAYANDMKG